jgi:AraC-like DNA-binding protein
VRAGELLAWDDGTLKERFAPPGTVLSYYHLAFVPLGISGAMSFRETGIHNAYLPSGPRVFHRILEELHQRFREKRTGYAQECSARVLNLLGHLDPGSRVIPEKVAGPDDRRAEKRIRDVLDYINLNYKKRLAVGQLAKIAGMHPAHLHKLFRREIGMTPHRYVLEKKIDKAKDFLAYYNESLTTTAQELGFHDYSHFCRAFVRLAGISPGTFKEKFR